MVHETHINVEDGMNYLKNILKAKFAQWYSLAFFLKEDCNG